MKLYNSLTNKKEEFVPLKEGEVKIYSCGPTVYNFFHIGNARPFIIFDTLRRYFEYKGNKVYFAQNFTDIDDKMIKKANEQGITIKELADTFIAEYYTDARGLKIKEATYHPKATENIDGIIEMIKTLIEKGYAYESGGDVYFSTKLFSEYGKLSHQPLDDLFSGARIEVTDIKKNPEDFALWKSAKDGEPYWESPFGKGRPGWHIECSVMAKKHLGETIDIHCGGKDLIFPHHENEIAQSECANGAPFARYWLHNGYINVDNRKMSKSEGNFFTVREVSELYSYEAIRFFMLSSHYRSPINYSRDIIESASAGLKRLYNTLADLEFSIQNAKEFTEGMPNTEKFKKAFEDAMEDDLNTAQAIGTIFELVKEINAASRETHSKAYLTEYKKAFLQLTIILGLLEPQQNNKDKEIDDFVEQRAKARANKDFKRSDEIRDKLKELGYIIEDTKEGQKLKRI